MDVRKKMVLIVTASILLTAVPGATLIYGYAQRNILANETTDLEKETAEFSTSAMQRFAQGEPKLAALAHLLEKELAKPVQPGEIAAFHQIMERNPDGVWRNRKPGYDGKNEAGIFLPPNAQQSDAQKVRHLRIKRIMDTFGAAASKPLENVWYLSPHRSEIIFDRALPEFAFEQKADNDYTQTPWVTYTSPQLNPKREFRFTPPLFDPVPKIWMVSALYPLYVDGQWIGTLGEDMPLTSVLEVMFSKNQIYSNVHHFLLDQQGNFVLAGPWQKQLESSTVTYRPDLSQSPQLAALLKSPLTSAPRTLSDKLIVNGYRHIAIGIRLEPLGWRYYRLTSMNEIMAPTRQLFFALAGMIVLITVLTGTLIGTATGRSITRRIKMLSDVMKGYASDRHRRVSTQVEGDDEIAEAAHIFDNMAEDISRSIAERLQVADALKASEELWRFALEGSGDGVWDVNVQTGEAHYSTQWKQMLGYAEDEVGHRHEDWVGLMHPEDLARVMASVQAYSDEHQEVYAIEYRLRCKDGRYKWILARGMAVSRDAEGKPIRMVGTHTDITERKLSEERLRTLFVAIEQSPTSIVITDLEANLQYVNPQFSRVTGYTAEEVLGANTRVLQSGLTAKEIYRDLWDTVTAGQVWHGELVNRRKNGEIYWEEAHISPVLNEDGVITQYVGIKFEITARKMNEAALIKAKEQAEQATAIKSSFLANMSHEIRTPMNAIIGLSQLALNKQVSPEIRDYLEKIRSSSDSLLGILNDILDYSKMEAGRMQVEHVTFDLDAVLNTLGNLFTNRAEEKQLKFAIEIAPEVPRSLVGDALRIQQVLTNLLGNAFKFTDHGQINLKVVATKTGPSAARLQFSVQDSGVGIPQENIVGLFQPFSQGDGSITRRFGGTGLGLAISHQLLKLMGSEMQVESMPGQGSIFSFTLDLDIAPEASTHERDRRQDKRKAGTLSAELRAHGQALAGACILVAEDNLINQQVVREFLQLSGIKVEVAENGQKVLDLLENQTFDAILMDAHMPVMGGIEATQHIRQQARYTALPIIALTAGVTSEERENCLASGMNDFVGKPINPDELLAVLLQWIKPNAEASASQPAENTEALRNAALVLDRLLRENDFIHEEVLDEIKAHLASSMQGQFAMLRKQISNIQYDRARLTLRTLTDLTDQQES